MRILVVDDHTLFRDALVQYLERADPGIELKVAKDFYGAEALLAKDSMYDLVLLDFRMPGMNGHEGLQTLKNKYPDLRIALMSGVAEPEDVTKSMDIGAAGYFPKTLSGKALLKAIQSVLAGQRFMPLDQDSRMMPAYYNDSEIKSVKGYGDQEIGAPHEEGSVTTAEEINLTPREREVLGFLMKGASNKEIAREIGLQVVTIKLHVRGICRKLNVKNRTQAALQAKELGLMSGSRVHGNTG